MATNRQHVVIWDGRKSGPGGAMIFAEQSSCLPQPATPAFAEGPKRLRACAVILAQEWRTVRQIADVAGISVKLAHSTIHNLAQRGVMDREHDWSRGRSAQQRYRWQTKGDAA